MRGKVRRKIPEIVLREGKPSAVILDIDDYREMLERLEEIEDLNMLKEMKKRPLKFRKLNVLEGPSGRCILSALNDLSNGRFSRVG